MCEKLKKLDVSHNRLRALPDTFDELRMLNVMNLSHNYLNELPQSCSWGCINLVRGREPQGVIVGSLCDHCVCDHVITVWDHYVITVCAIM